MMDAIAQRSKASTIPRELSRRQLKFAKSPLANAIVLALLSPAAFSQTQGAARLEEIVVTAQKRDETMQRVPLSIDVLTNQALSELNLQSFSDYAQMVPSIFTTPGMDEGSSFAGITMRAINSGSRGHPSSNAPTVGMYLDEMPLTTQQGNVDVHLYDIARIEVLQGPQGTLFGASSQAGTIRIISNTPELGQAFGGISLEGNTVDFDDTGYVMEGFVNAPINDNMAIRLVGWSRETAGWIDNVLGSRTFKGVEDADTCAASGVDCSDDDITLTNENRARDNYNTVDTIGARAALRIELNENWTVSPTVMAQQSKSEGHRGEDISGFVPRKQAVTHFMNQYTDDQWYMLGLTIEGKVGNFDLTYSGGYLERDVDGSYDYADYAYWYDAAYTTGFYADLNFQTGGARPIENQFFPGLAGSRNVQGYASEVYDQYERETHEIRITSDRDKRIRGMLGAFYMDSYHDYSIAYRLPGLADIMQFQGGDPFLTKDTFYLNSMDRFDDEKAVFGHVDYDITDNLELTVGARFFKPQQKVIGFTGYSMNTNLAGWSSSGELRCDQLGNGQAEYQGKKNLKPCLNVDKNISESESIYRANLNYRATDDVMLYATYSEGYRPGGINRNPNQSEFLSEFLTNYEVGWKTQFMDQRLQFNGAAFYNEWDDFQITFAGENSITQIGNGPSAEILGLEANVIWIVTDALKISAAGARYEAELSSDFVDFAADGSVLRTRAPKGTPLPGTPDFKGNVVARYEFPIGGFDGYVQSALTYVGERRSALQPADYAVSGDYSSITLLDLAAGLAKGSWSFDMFVNNATNNDTPWYDTAQCATATCGSQRYAIRERPTTVAFKVTKRFD